MNTFAWCTLGLVALSLSASAGAQAPAPAPAANQSARSRVPMRFPAVALHSPEVLPDGRVTLRFHASEAPAVSVVGEITRGTGPVAMSKGDDGVWTATLGPLPPEIYSYNFRVAGADVLDPSNPSLKPTPPGEVVSNFVEVPGPEAALYDEQPVPHGQVRMLLYDSAVMGVPRWLWVYTPPRYDASHTAFPVLYLLHGNGEDQAGWVRNGRANIILDNLIAQGKARPMVVVMPQGHALQAAGVAPLKRIDADETSMFTPRFEPDLLQVIVPLVESQFRVRRDADSRAIAGLSMGGGQALSIGLSHPAMFHYVLGLSAAIGPSFLDISPLVQKVESNPQAINSQLKLLWISTGRQDFLHAEDAALAKSLEASHVRVDFQETDGGHVWSVWRHNLIDFAPLLFSSKQ